MNNIIICTSVHNKNTEKVAKAIAEELGSIIVKPNEVELSDILKYDIVGFGSGIYFGKLHQSLYNLVEKMPSVENKKAFIFSTSGISASFFFNKRYFEFKNILEEKGFDVLGNFNCLGFDNYSLLKVIGGVNKGRPNEEDIKRARAFARKIKENYDRKRI